MIFVGPLRKVEQRAIPSHSHAETHLLIVLEGRLELEIDGAVHSVPAGYCAEVPPNHTHQLRCADESPMKFLAIKWR